MWNLMPGDRVQVDGNTSGVILSWGRGSDGGIVYGVLLDDDGAIYGVEIRRLAVGGGREEGADRLGNRVAREGCDRCACGCKYWENDRCIDCGEPVSHAIKD